jgi:tryptophan synthase beta chain
MSWCFCIRKKLLLYSGAQCRERRRVQIMSTKITLPESEIPTHWYNIVADLPVPPPPVLHPGTHEPIGPDDLAPLFPMDLILQEVNQDRNIEIHDEII